VVGQLEGCVVCVPLFGQKYPDAPGEEYRMLLETKLDSQTLKSIAGKQQMPWLIILGIVVVIIIGILGYKYMNSGSVVENGKNTITVNSVVEK
jgi:hypothetical protein